MLNNREPAPSPTSTDFDPAGLGSLGSCRGLLQSGERGGGDRQQREKDELTRDGQRSVPQVLIVDDHTEQHRQEWIHNGDRGQARNQRARLERHG